MEHIQCVKCRCGIVSGSFSKLHCDMPICFKCLRNCQFTKAKRIFCSICNMHHNIGKLTLSLHDGIENHTSLPKHEYPFSDLAVNLFDDSTDLELIDIALNQEHVSECKT